MRRRSGAFVQNVIAAGWKSVEKTPTLLRVLADAGVVDAGGFGLVVLVEGAANGRGGGKTADRHSLRAAGRRRRPATNRTLEEESDFTYCTSFLLSGSGLDRASLEDRLGRLGDSLLVVGDDRQLKVHVHTDEPGAVLGIAGPLGVADRDRDRQHEGADGPREIGAWPAAAAQPLVDRG